MKINLELNETEIVEAIQKHVGARFSHIPHPERITVSLSQDHQSGKWSADCFYITQEPKL